MAWPRVSCLFAAWIGVGLAGCSSPTVSTGPSPNPPLMETAPPPPPPSAPPTARYRVTFESTWSRTTHPTDFPDSAHYSGLIGGTHRGDVVFWQEGGFATEGIRQMAERGRKSPLDSEVQRAIASGNAEHLLSGPDLDDTPGTVSMEFDVSQGFPLVTLVTMIAPSPDWFVGVSGLPLVESGQWRDDVVVELSAFDAGTDSGVSYRSSDRPTDPRQPIARLQGYPVETNGQIRSFGTLTFVRVD